MQDAELEEGAIAVDVVEEEKTAVLEEPGRTEVHAVLSEKAIGTFELHNAPDWMQVELEKMVEAIVRGQSSSTRNAPCGQVQYFKSYAIDRAGSLRDGRRARYKVLNEVALPNTAKLSGSLCFNCGDTGHAVRACPQPFDGPVVRRQSRLFREAKGNAGPKSLSAPDARYYQQQQQQPPKRESRTPNQYPEAKRPRTEYQSYAPRLEPRASPLPPPPPPPSSSTHSDRIGPRGSYDSRAPNPSYQRGDFHRREQDRASSGYAVRQRYSERPPVARRRF